LPDGSYFGNLYAIDPNPNEHSDARTISGFEMFADLIAHHSGSHGRSHGTPRCGSIYAACATGSCAITASGCMAAGSSRHSVLPSRPRSHVHSAASHHPCASLHQNVPRIVLTAGPRHLPPGPVR
jgi:hypothetical protein